MKKLLLVFLILLASAASGVAQRVETEQYIFKQPVTLDTDVEHRVNFSELTDKGTEVGATATGTDMGAGFGYGSNGNGSGSGFGYLTYGPFWGAAFGIESEGNNCGAAFGAVTIAPDHAAGIGSFSSSLIFSALCGGNSLSLTNSTAGGFNSIAWNNSVVMGYNAQSGTSGGSNVVIGARAAAGTMDGSLWGQTRTQLDWNMFYQHITLSDLPSPHTAGNGEYTIDAHGGDVVWSIFRFGVWSIHFLYTKIEIYNGATLIAHRDIADGMMPDMWTQLIFELTGQQQFTLEAGGTVLLFLYSPHNPTEVPAVGCGSIGAGAYSKGINTWAIGTGTTNLTDNTTFIGGDAVVVTNNVKALRLMFSDGSFLAKHASGTLIYVSTGNVTNSVTLGAAP